MSKWGFRLRRLRVRRGEDPDTGEPLEKAGAAYVGPMSVADINLASWDEFFREGGSLNQPAWLQTNRLKDLKKQFTLLARLHQKV